MSNLRSLWRINGQPVGQCAEPSALLRSYNNIMLDNTRLRRRIGEVMFSELRLSQRNGFLAEQNSYLTQANRRMAAEVRRWKLIAAVAVIAAAGLASVLMLVVWG